MATVDDLPRRAAARTARLAGLPLGYAGRAEMVHRDDMALAAE